MVEFLILLNKNLVSEKLRLINKGEKLPAISKFQLPLSWNDQHSALSMNERNQKWKND